MLIFSSVFFLLAVNAVFSVDYCKIPCKRGKHTMCAYPARISSSCGKVKRSGLTLEEKKIVLKRHNEIRQEIATGKTTSAAGVLPQAADMKELIWDPELERVADRWIKQCQDGHDQCRNVERFNVGQNIAMKSPDAPGIEVAMVNLWYKEKDDFDDLTEIDSFKGATLMKIGHFTALASSRTRYIGCSSLRFNEKVQIICDYGPAGNMIGLPLYKSGDSCSACPDGYFCSKEFNGLCTDNTKSDFSGSSRLQKFSLLGIISFVTILYYSIQNVYVINIY